MKLSRRELLGIGCICGLISAACVEQQKRQPLPISTPSPTGPILAVPFVTPTPDIITSKIEEGIRKDVLKLDDNYHLNLRQKMVNFWLQGTPTAAQYTKDGQAYLFSAVAAKTDLQLTDMARTTISLIRRSLSTGGSALVFEIEGSYNPGFALGVGLPEATVKQLRAMNFEHEAVVSIAYLNGMISAGKNLGLDFRTPSRPASQEDQKLSDLKRYRPIIIAYAEAVAELNDYFLTYPLFDKDLQSGQILFATPPDSQTKQPLIGGSILLEAGITYIIDQTIGSSLKGINSLDQLAEKYPSVENIPRGSEYLRQIREHFSKDSITYLLPS